MDQHEVWRQFAAAALNGLMVNRQLPMSLADDFHFVENASDVVSKFADTMTQHWLDRQPKPRKRGTRCTH